LGLVKKDKQLYERKLCSFFNKPQKQIGRVYFSSTTKSIHPKSPDMKKCLYFLLILLLNCSGRAQNTQDTQVFAMPAGKKVYLNLKFGQEIRVKTWDRAELKFEPIITTTREDLKKIHVVDIEDLNDNLSIKTDYDKSINWNKISCCWCNDCDSLLRNLTKLPAGAASNSNCICLRVDYEITLPANTSLHLETIAGNIEIRGHNGEIRAKTISGFVDIDRPANSSSQLDFRSVTGEIFTDFNIKMNENSSAYSKKVATSINGGGAIVRAESISGNVYFRKRG
jgi:hypothetical protein